MKQAIGYIRVSTEQQSGDDRYGVSVQKGVIERYAKDNGYEIVEWKIDKASGATDHREKLDEILYGDVMNPPISAVIIFKNDRLARDMKLYFYYSFVLEKKNIKLLSTQEEFEEDSELANIYRALLQFVAEQERRNIALRTGQGRIQKASFGGYAGGRCPYGYQVIHGRLIVHPEEKKIVRRIFESRDAGMTYQDISDELYDSGYRSRVGKRLSTNTVRNILANRPLYEGLYKYGDMDWVAGVHEPILMSGEYPRAF